MVTNSSKMHLGTRLNVSETFSPETLSDTEIGGRPAVIRIPQVRLAWDGIGQ